MTHRSAVRRTVPNPIAARLLVAAVCLVTLTTGCSADRSEPSAEGSGTRTITHARGDTVVPTAPQRVVVLEPVQLDTSIALGVVPVGAATLRPGGGVPAYLGEAAAAITEVGTVAEPDVEKIAALEPDLIVGTESRHADLFAQLTGIAPTVFMESQADPWQENVAFVATALGDEEGATALLSAYEKRCQEIASKHETEGKTAQLIRPRDGQFALYGPTSFAGSTLECAGFATPDREWENSISVDVSAELIADTKADLVVVTTSDVDDPETIPAYLRDTAFPDLVPVDESFWITGVGPLGGMAVLDDLDRLLTASR